LTFTSRTACLTVLAAAGLCLSGCNCGPTSPGGDAGAPDAGAPDAGAPDAGPGDAGQSLCPDAGVVTSSLTVTETVHRFSGTTTATTTGEFVVQSDGGQALRGPLQTSAGGAYQVDVPLFCGPQTVELRWPGPVCADRVLVSVDRQQCTATDLQVTLTWDDLGLDFELHLIKPGGVINVDATDCTWTSCIGQSPDWGVPGDATDNPHKDVDNTRYFGPENIVLNQPESGVYWVLVEHWGVGLPTADGVVTISLAGSPSVTIPITDLASHFVRSVATIDWATRTVTPSSLVTDCTASWTSGCRLDLPGAGPPP
jgi:hypothetical protein